MADNRPRRKDLIKEIIKCGKDPVYFLTNYAKIAHPDKGLIQFSLFDYQEDIVDAYLKHRFNILLKARQLGVTTVTAGYIAWLMLFYRYKNCLVIATKQDVAKNTVKVVRSIYKYLPKWLFISKISTNNRLEIELDNGSRVKAMTTSGDVGRSEAVSFLAIDEVAHIQNFESMWTGIWPTVSTGGRVALFSTPNGTGNFFHQQYTQALSGENNFNCRLKRYYTNPNDQSESYNDRLMWWVHPDYDDDWFEFQTAGQSARDIAQERLCSFNASGDTLLFPEDLKNLENRVQKPQEQTNFDHNLWIWEYPVKNAMYLIACDVARGDSRDFSAFHVLRLDTPVLEQVAEYKGKVTPDILGLVLMEASKRYNNCMIAIENNGGWAGQAILKIKENKYPYLYYTSRRNKDEYIDPFYADMNKYAVPGYSITSANRTPMIAKMEEYIRKNYINLKSQRLVEELKTFVWNNNRPEAQKGYHDDLVMALAGALWVREESFISSYRDVEFKKMLVDHMSYSDVKTDQQMGFDFNTPGMHSRSQVKRYVQEQNEIVMGNGERMNLNWLMDSPPIIKGN